MMYTDIYGCTSQGEMGALDDVHACTYKCRFHCWLYCPPSEFLETRSFHNSNGWKSGPKQYLSDCGEGCAPMYVHRTEERATGAIYACI
jgi:hypothetical protein